MKPMTTEVAYELQCALEGVRSKLGGVLAVYHDCGQTEWTGGPSGDPDNHKVPAPEVATAFRCAIEALNLLTKADHELVMWGVRGALPFQRGDDDGAEWFRARFES